MARVLIVEDKESMAEMLRSALEVEGFQCAVASTEKEAIETIRSEVPELVLADLKLPDGSGLEVLKASLEEDPSVPVIIMTAYGSIETAVEAMKQGAYEFITKPFDLDHLIMLIKRAIERRDLYRENLLLKEHLATEEIVGKSTAMQGVMEKVRKVAPTKTTVLLLGESGTGKELIARAIHKLSPRRDKLFVPINCAAIPRELLESELFGYEKGAFTGATSRKPGKFEIANGGTVFLDEISELELSLQAKLLRVLQDQMIERVGGTRPLKVDVRIIAATNADLKKRVQEGKFREDLYYRLNVFPIEIPPLRERKEDIPLLVEHFIKKYAREMKVPPKKVKDRAMKLLMQYEWKGNVRELENTIERAMILAEGDEIGPEHISLVGVDTGEPLGETLTQGVSLEEAVKEVVRRVERRIIQEALERHHWNKTRVAEELQVSYKTLLTKIKEYGLE